MEKKSSQFIDVDKIVVVPSPQRVRNILTLEERVRAIQAYDCRPMYTKVAKMFNCSWEQIKNIIANRNAIMEFYAATKNMEKALDPNQDEIRRRKITFLGECMYEYIQRVQFHTKADITEALIRTKALEFRDVIQIANFMPNKAWINHFKATYNFSLSNRQIMLTRTPPASLELKDIMTYCTKNKPKVEVKVPEPLETRLYKTTTKISVSIANDAAVEELKQRRQRKITFLEKALCEYVERAQYHKKGPLNDDRLREIAIMLKDMLKVPNFAPSKVWIAYFKNRYEIKLSSKAVLVVTRTPPFSLDLKDILSYCSRHEQKNQTTVPVTLAPKEQQRNLRSSVSAPENKQHAEGAKIKVRNLGANSYETHQPSTEIKQEVIELEDDDQEDVKPNVAELERDNDDCQPPPMKIQKIESMCDTAESTVHSPGHWSEHSDKEDEELPKQVKSYADALKVLKPLEEFAMLQENYRVIGLISQLEEIFKNPPKSGEQD